MVKKQQKMETEITFRSPADWDIAAMAGIRK